MRTCECGCGESPRTKRARFVLGHNRRGETRETCVAWRGGRHVTGQGYARIYRPDHPRNNRGYIWEHVAVVEAALGHLLRPSAPVHHVDENRQNNANTNLVACDSAAYHQLLHRRMRAYLASGDPDARCCKFCGLYDRQDDIRVYPTGKSTFAVHLSCSRDEVHRRNGNKTLVPNRLAKLSEDQVREIRALRAAGMLLTEIAGRYSVSAATVSNIANARSWRIVA